MSGPTATDDFVTFFRTATAEEVEQAERVLGRIAERCYLASLYYGRDWNWMVGEINRVTAAMVARRAELKAGKPVDPSAS